VHGMGDNSYTELYKSEESLTHQGYSSCEDETNVSPDSIPTKTISKDSTGCAYFRELAKELLDTPPQHSVASIFQYFIIIAILSSTVCVVLETVEALRSRYGELFDYCEGTFTVFFTIEILLRTWTAEESCAYIKSAPHVIDILSVSPWYLLRVLELVFQHELTSASVMKQEATSSFLTLRMIRMVRMLRLMRVLRIAKAMRHSDVITTVVQSMQESATGLKVLVAWLFSGAIFSATLIYYCECDDPETRFDSIPASMWWSVVTMTGVGYGDMVPANLCSKFVAAATMAASMFILPVTTAMITSSFIDRFQRNMQKKTVEQSEKKKLKKRASLIFVRQYSDDIAPPKTDDIRRNLHNLEEEFHKILSDIQALQGNQTSTDTIMALLQTQTKALFGAARQAVDATP